MRRVIAWDTETCRFRPGRMAPELVCVTWQSPGEPAGIEHHSTVYPRLRAWLQDPAVVLVGHNVAYDLAVVGERFPDLVPAIFTAYEADRVADTMIRQWLLDNAAGAFRGYQGPKGKWISFEYSLEALARRLLQLELTKDAWRTSYGEFIDIPLEQWPVRALEVQAKAAIRLESVRLQMETLKKSSKQFKDLKKELVGLEAMIASRPERCREYCLDDARATLAVYLEQERFA